MLMLDVSSILLATFKVSTVYSFWQEPRECLCKAVVETVERCRPTGIHVYRPLNL